jgi:hypothetical protein
MRKRLLVILLVSLIIGLSFSVTASAYYKVYVNLDSVGQLPQPIYAAGAVYFNGSIYLMEVRETTGYSTRYTFTTTALGKRDPHCPSP